MGLTDRQENRRSRHGAVFQERALTVSLRQGAALCPPCQSVGLGKHLGGIAVFRDLKNIGTLVVWKGHWEEVPAPP